MLSVNVFSVTVDDSDDDDDDDELLLLLLELDDEVVDLSLTAKRPKYETRSPSASIEVST
jgi:hypothetical protein